MKIVLIMPRSELYQKGRGFRKNLRYAPLTLTSLAAYTPKELNAKITLFDEGIEKVDYEKIEADIVGITCITGTANRAYMIADKLRKKRITVVIGGAHASLMPKEAKKHADSIVIGLANKTWPELLNDYKKNKLKEMYYDPNPLLTNLPFPRRDLLKKRDYITINTVQAVYGCPYKCDFCVVHKIRQGYLKRPINEVIDEIKKLKSGLVLFLDSSPIEDRIYIKELYRQLIPLKIKWMGLSTTRIIEDEELLDLAVKSGCAGLLIGFESISQISLTNMNKKHNIIEEYKGIIAKLHSYNIAIMGCFVFGLDEEDKSVFKKTVDFIVKTGIDLPRFTIYTPYPGTDLFDRMKKEKRILTEDWSKYNCQNVVFQPKKMSVKELQEGLEWAWKEVYSTKNIIKRITKSKTRLFYNLILNLGYKKYARDLPKYK